LGGRNEDQGPNSQGKGASGYLVIGVSDKDRCPRPTDPYRYIHDIPIPSRGRFQGQLNNILRAYVYPHPAVECYQLKHEETGRRILTIVIQAWQEIDPRPFVIIKGIGKIKEGQIWLRHGSDSYVAHRDELVELAAGHVRTSYEHQIRQLRNSHHQQIERLNRELDERGKTVEDLKLKIDEMRDLFSDEIERQRQETENLKKQFSGNIQALEQRHREEVKRLYGDIDQQREDFSRERQWLDDQLRALKEENTSISRQEREWRLFARSTLQELYRVLPDDSRERRFRQYLALHGKEDLAEDIASLDRDD
jgi:hypothetical protein